MKAMLCVEDGDLRKWIDEEQKFLLNLKAEPKERVVECAYVEVLITREKAECV